VPFQDKRCRIHVWILYNVDERSCKATVAPSPTKVKSIGLTQNSQVDPAV
jgi:hypothetical protein